MSRGKRSPITITHKKVVDYWKYRAVSEDGNIYIDYGYEGCDEHLLKKVKSEPIIIDWGEPTCFACGRAADSSIYSKYDFEDPEDFWTTKEVKSALERCHIVADSLGGLQQPSNIFLMCSSCHRESPDTVYPQQFFKWVYRRRQYKYSGGWVGEAIRELQSDYGIEYPKFTEEDYTKWYEKATSHGGTIVESTKKAALIGLALEKEKEFAANYGVTV